MLIIVSKDITHNALKKLEKYGDIFLFETQNITYKAIQNHPDIFLLLHNKTIVSAPNAPETLINELISKGYNVIPGHTPVGSSYPQTAIYNAVLTEQYLIHNLKFTETAIKAINPNVRQLDVSQGYCRCNLLALPNNTFITSDKGILNVLHNEGLKTLYINPENITLDGFSNGFFGGCCGISNKYLFMNGSLNYFNEKSDIEQFANNAKLEIIELSNRKSEDIGSILVLQPIY